MESKVILYDSSNTKIGETYTRRARQLVKQQRATWTDESHTAIRFAPGMENMDDTFAAGAGEGYATHTGSPSDKELMKLAKQRVHARFAFKLHLALFFILCPFWILIYMLTDPGGYFWPIWPILGFGLSVAVHGVVYKFMVGNSMSEKIAQEYEQLKHRRSFSDFDDRRG